MDLYVTIMIVPYANIKLFFHPFPRSRLNYLKTINIASYGDPSKLVGNSQAFIHTQAARTNHFSLKCGMEIRSFQERSRGAGTLQKGKPVKRFETALKHLREGVEAVGEHK